MRPAKPVPKMLVSQIRQDGGTQSRASLHDDVVADYAEAYRTGAVMPPVTLFYDGTDHWLADGFHRVAAAVAAKAQRIPAEILQGSQRDAILHSVGANSSHGLRRSNADKRRAVSMLLRDEEWGKKSDRWIADSCDVSAPFVAELRAAVQQKELTVATRQGQDGKERRLPVEKDSQKPSGDAPASYTGEPSPGEETGDDEREGAGAFGAQPAPSLGESPAQALPAQLVAHLEKAAALISQAQGYLTRIESEALGFDPAVLQRLQLATVEAARQIRQATPAMVCPWCKDADGAAGRREHCVGCMQAGYLRKEQVGDLPPAGRGERVADGKGGWVLPGEWAPPPPTVRLRHPAVDSDVAAVRVRPGRVEVLLVDDGGGETPFEPVDDTRLSDGL